MPQDLLARRRLGPIDVEVPAISIGCAPLGNMPDTFAYSVADDIAHATIRAALESPLNWLDTAAAYGDGESERRIGHVLRELGGLPAGAFLDTKVGASPQGDYSAETVRQRFLRGLELLGMERIELVFLHDPEHARFEDITAPNGPLDVLRHLKDEGLIGHLGVAGGPIDMEIRYVELGIFDAVITHNRYTLLNRSADPLLTTASERGLAVLNAAPYGSGILAKGPSQYPRYAYSEAPGTMVERAKAMEAICARHDVPLAAAALQFSLRDPRITGTIVGMTRPERIEQTLDLARVEIPDACWEELLAVPFDTGNPQD
jgi:D-threo-aldose 1-dehydrogenase